MGQSGFPVEFQPGLIWNPRSNQIQLYTVRAITRNGYTVTSWEMAIWPPKLGTLYKVPSELFSGLKSSLFPQGFAHNTAEQWSFDWVRKKWRLARRLRVSRRKPHCFVLFLLWFVHDKTPNRWKNQVRCNFFRIWKKYVVNVYKICFHLVVFLYWSMTALLGPRFLKMKYCSFATCVCYWPSARTMLWTWFRSVFTLFSDRQMEKHCDFLKKHCRLCGKKLSKKGWQRLQQGIIRSGSQRKGSR